MDSVIKVVNNVVTVFEHRQTRINSCILLSQSEEVEMRLPSTVSHRVPRARLRTQTRNWQPAMCLGLQLAAMTCRWIHLCRCAHDNSVDVTLVKRVQQYQPFVTPSKTRCMRRRLIRTTPTAALLDLWVCEAVITILTRDAPRHCTRTCEAKKSLLAESSSACERHQAMPDVLALRLNTCRHGHQSPQVDL